MIVPERPVMGEVEWWGKLGDLFDVIKEQDKRIGILEKYLKKVAFETEADCRYELSYELPN